MTDVTIDRIHAGYHGFEPGDVERLDRALGQVVDRHLSPALAARDLPDVFAVCLRSVDVVVDLGSGCSLETWGRRWAEQLADGIVAAASSGQTTAEAGFGVHPVVVYRREIDVVVDLVTSVASGDQHRLWAWNQTGVWPRSSWPGSDDVARLLASRPTMAAAVLRLAGRRPVPLTVIGWFTVAAAVARTFSRAGGPTAPGGGDPPHIQHADVRTPDDVSDDVSSPTPLAAAEYLSPVPSLDPSAVAATIPRLIWDRATPDQLITLAVLALAIHKPLLARNQVVIEAVAVAAVGRQRAVTAPAPTVPGEHKTTQTHRPQTDDQPEATTESGSEHDKIEPMAEAEPMVEGEPVVESAFGGVIFLIHVLRELGVVEAAIDHTTDGPVDEDVRDRRPSPSMLLARIVAAVTAVNIDDPIVAIIAGLDGDDDLDDHRLLALGSASSDFVDQQAQRIVDWLHDRTGEPELNWIWSRSANIDRQPGWMDVEFSLDSVDLRIRSTGLDLDPGFVWWLGAVVRFRYV